MGCISLMSMESIFPFLIIWFATCDHPPGADPRSNKLVSFFINIRHEPDLLIYLGKFQL